MFYGGGFTQPTLVEVPWQCSRCGSVQRHPNRHGVRVCSYCGSEAPTQYTTVGDAPSATDYFGQAQAALAADDITRYMRRFR